MALARGIIMAGHLAEGAAQASRPSAEDAIVFLERALKIVDELALPPNIGARVQEAIEYLGSRSWDSRSSRSRNNRNHCGCSLELHRE
jgi:hypothetical protein